MRRVVVAERGRWAGHLEGCKVLAVVLGFSVRHLQLADEHFERLVVRGADDVQHLEHLPDLRAVELL